jgi:hypothetical protein
MASSVKQPAAFTITVFRPSAFIQCLKAKRPPQPAQVGVPGSIFSSGGMFLIDFIRSICRTMFTPSYFSFLNTARINYIYTVIADKNSN